MKIGVFDSGIGGLTVLSELLSRFPHLDFFYLGDTAHLPYGTKSPAQIVQLSIRCAELLKEQRVDGVVVACNTASAWALDSIQSVMGPVPVLGVVDPGVSAVSASCQSLSSSAPVLVLATRATIRSGAYRTRLEKILDPSYIPVIEQACPLLVPMIEEGWVDHPILHQTILEYVAPHRSQNLPGVALLGCTHYPWIQAAIAQALPGWKVINSAEAICEALLATALASEIERNRSQGQGRLEITFTDADAVPAFAQQLVNKFQWKGKAS